MNRLRLLAIGLVAACSAAGCSGGSYASVSGVITLNGKPHRSAFVSFEPIGTPDNPTPGRGSTGRTDENGRFTLRTFDGHAGAVPGKHKIRFTTRYSEKLRGYELWDAVKNDTVKSVEEPVPPEWNFESRKEFTVPPGGTDKANFDIINPAIK